MSKVISGNCHLFNALFALVVIFRSDYFGNDFTQLFENALKAQKPRYIDYYMLRP